jgi:hypothetical protein
VCRESLDAVMAGAPDGGAEHLPASVLARWPAVADEMPALERELIEQHLADCAWCREDLQLSGRARAGSTGTPRRTEPWRTRASWLGVWATTATAAAAALALLWWHGPHDRPPSRAIVAAPPPMALHITSAAVRLEDVMRGAAPASPTLVEPGAGEPVALGFDPAFVADETPVELELASRTGSTTGPTLARAMHTQRELYPGRSLLVGDEASPLADGDYRLRVIEWPGTARADTQSYAFTVRRRR